MEKGGKASTKGKHDGSAKMNGERRVQFDSAGKGGKANGGKASASKDSQPLQLKIEDELPKDVSPILDCEAAQILQGIQEQMILLSQDPTIKLPVSFDKGLQYAKSTACYENPQSVREILDYLTQFFRTLKRYGVSDGEICVIGNVCPETADEVFGLVPSLKYKKGTIDEPLKDVLGQIGKLKQSS